MKQLFIFFSIALLSTAGLAQTKRIAHKSHSGAEETFLIAYENNLFEMEYDNEGLRTEDYVKYTEPIVPLPDTMIRTKGGIFTTYKEVLLNDSLFNVKPSLTDTLRKFFKQQIPASSTAPKKNGYLVPYVSTDLPKPPSAGKPWIYVGFIALFAAFTGLFSWKYKHA
jgi:hypothetical protein